MPDLKPGWNMLFDDKQLAEYRAAFTRSCGLSHPQWSASPQAYPCLVTSALMPGDPPQIISAYVYPEEAAELVSAANGKPGAAAPAAASLEGQEEFNRVTAANVLALVRILEDTGIIKREQYEKRLTVELARVDQWNAEIKHRATKRLVAAAGPVLPKLYPKKGKD